MADNLIVYDALRERRQRYWQYFWGCFTLIVIGLLSLLAYPAWKIVVFLLLAPIFFGGYSAAFFARNYFKEYFISSGRPDEDAELGSIVIGVVCGVLGVLVLAGMLVVGLLFLRAIGVIVFNT